MSVNRLRRCILKPRHALVYSRLTCSIEIPRAGVTITKNKLVGEKAEAARECSGGTVISMCTSTRLAREEFVIHVTRFRPARWAHIYVMKPRLLPLWCACSSPVDCDRQARARCTHPGRGLQIRQIVLVQPQECRQGCNSVSDHGSLPRRSGSYRHHLVPRH